MIYAARNIGLNGWVKNCDDDTVEATVQGTEKQVNEIIEWARKGPSMARVESVEVSEGFGQYSSFEIVSH